MDTRGRRLGRRAVQRDVQPVVQRAVHPAMVTTGLAHAPTRPVGYTEKLALALNVRGGDVRVAQYRACHELVESSVFQLVWAVEHGDCRVSHCSLMLVKMSSI